jgi:hypothetical protein
MLEMPRSIWALTVVLMEALLLAGTGSAFAAESVAELVSVPPAVGVTMIDALNVEPFGTTAQLHVTTPVRYEQVPLPFAVALTKVDEAGIVSLRETAVAGVALRFDTLTLYVTLPVPSVIGSGLSVMLEMLMSTDCANAGTLTMKNRHTAMEIAIFFT